MTPRALLLVTAAAVSGWAAGEALRRDPVAAAAVPAQEAQAQAAPRKPAIEPTVPPASAVPLRSLDTRESLEGLKGGELHARLALWLIDAPPEEIAAFWEHYRTTWTEEDLRPPMALLAVGGWGTGRNEIGELIFLHWSRHDPAAALAAAKAAGQDYLAWRGWAAHDPRAALDAALADGKVAADEVARALGLYQPAWVRAHFDELPEDLRGTALEGLIADESGNDPAANLRFLAKLGYGLTPGCLAAAIRDDPWAAYDWIEHLEESGHGSRARSDREEFIRTAGEEHPEVIEALLRTTPEGALKRQMEAALFRNRLATDPEGAIREALETRAPAVAVKRLADAGTVLLESDPERAFELAKHLFGFPDAFDSSIKIQRDGTTTVHLGGEPNGGADFAKELMARDPARVLDLAVAGNGNGSDSTTFSQLARMWSEMDPEGLGTWAAGQADEVHDAAGYHLVMHHQQRGDFAAESDAVARLRGSQRKTYLQDTLTRWHAADPAAAAAWLDRSSLPAAEVEALRNHLPAEP